MIGQDRAGKTSLKKSIFGLPFDPKEQSTTGIEVDPSRCEIDVDQIKKWHSTSKKKKAGLLEGSKDVEKMVADELRKIFDGGKVRLTDEDGNIFQSKQV